jgi:hypothetical protein
MRDRIPALTWLANGSISAAEDESSIENGPPMAGLISLAAREAALFSDRRIAGDQPSHTLRLSS